jgi:hypothetical protein
MTKQEVSFDTGWFWLALFLLFLTLKLTGVIAWSWWWVTAPLWGPVVVVLVILGVIWFLVWLFAILEGLSK